MNEPLAKVTDEMLPENKACEICGHILTKKIHPEEEDLKEFIRALLGDRPFVKKYSLYNGQYNLTYKTLISSEASRLSMFLTKILTDDKLTKIEKRENVVKIKLLFYLESINGVFISSPEEESLELLLKRYAKDFESDSENAISIYVKTLIQFLFLQKLLIEEGYDANFWKGAGLL